ncbi:MAG: DUF4367 domain-containing protein [Dehalococcoidia bacterium]
METDLMALAQALPYPPTPDLAAGFWSRLQAERETRAAAPAWSLAAVAMATVVVAVSVVAGTVAPARDAAAELFDRINIFEADEDAFEGVTQDIVGEDVTLEEAEIRMGRGIDLPKYPAGIEDAITRVVFQHISGPGSAEYDIAHVFFEPEGSPPFVLFATDASTGKGLAPGAGAERLTGFEGEAYWLHGRRLAFIYDNAGNVIRETQRVTEANTVIWVHEGHTYRIEGELDREEAIKIAQSVK